MKKWPLKFRVYVSAANVDSPDYTKIPGAKIEPGRGVSVPVFAHEVVRSQQIGIDGTLFTEEIMRIYAPPGYFTAGQALGHSFEKMNWRVTGNAEDSNANPWWQPGLSIYYAKVIQ